jgi:hypothetical protein
MALLCAEEGLAIARSIRDEVVVPWLLFVVGQARRFQGETETALRVLHESLRLERELGDLGAAGFILRSLAEVAMERGDYFAATELLQERLTLSRTLNDRWNSADTIEGLAWLAREQAWQDRAARLFGAADAMREATGTRLLGARLVRHEQRVVSLRADLGETRFRAAWGEGYCLTYDEIVEYALAVEQPVSPQLS